MEYKRPLAPKTYDRIFNAEKKAKEYNNELKQRRIRRSNTYRDCIGKIFEEQGKVTKQQNIAEKPCNDNFRILSAEAKKNRYHKCYYDKNKKQW